MKVGMFHNADKKRLEVIVTRVDELSGADLGDSPSTYVRLCLLPKESPKYRSRIEHNTLVPTFDERYSFYEPLDALKRMQVHLTLWKYDSAAGNRPVGELLLDLQNVYENARIDTWLPLLRPTKHMEDANTSADEPGNFSSHVVSPSGPVLFVLSLFFITQLSAGSTPWMRPVKPGCQCCSQDTRTNSEYWERLR